MTQTALNPQQQMAALTVPEGPMSALIIDDQEVDRRSLRRVCAKAGMTFEVSEAADVAELRKQLETKAFDFVFIDYHLGMETGLQALRLVTAHPDQMEAIPIMVTSVGEHEVILEAMRSGCADYLIKDEITVDAIRKAISSALERRILLAALSRERTVRLWMTSAMERFAQSCAPEMRKTLSIMLRRIRGMRLTAGADQRLTDGLNALTGDCENLFAFLEDMQTAIEDGNSAPVTVHGLPGPGA